MFQDLPVGRGAGRDLAFRWSQHGQDRDLPAID